MYEPLDMCTSSLALASLASRRMRAVPWVRRIATEVSLVLEKSLLGGGAMTSL